MRFVYPQSVLEPRVPEDLFCDEAYGMAAAGHVVQLVDTEALDSGPARLRPPIESSAAVVYRGWMLTYDAYLNFAASVARTDGACFTTPAQYVATHYLPKWYALARDYTPETVVFDRDAESCLRRLRRFWHDNTRNNY